MNNNLKETYIKEYWIYNETIRIIFEIIYKNNIYNIYVKVKFGDLQLLKLNLSNKKKQTSIQILIFL